MCHRLLAALVLLTLTAQVAASEDAAAASSGAADSTWQLEKDADGIQVFTRPVAGSSHKAVRARMAVTTPIPELVALIRDTEACAEWAQFCAESHAHEIVSETEAYIYTLNEMPWPVTDRDALSKVLWSADEASGQVRMDAVATEGILAPNRGRVRLTDARTSWSFLPLADGQVEVLTEAHVNPAGPVPAWITNMLLVDAPFETMRKLRALAATGRYAGASFEFMPAGDVHSR